MLKQREILQRPLTNLEKVVTRRIAEIAVKPKEKMEAGAESYDILEGRPCNFREKLVKEFRHVDGLTEVRIKGVDVVAAF